MESRRFILLSAIFLFGIAQMQAQWDAPFSRFWAAKTYYNPSFAGETGKIRLSGLYKYQWAAIENAPKHMLLSADMPVEFFGWRHGVGVIAYNTSIGNERNSLIAAQYTFKQKLGKGILHIGIQAGMLELNFDAASIHLITDSAKNNRKTVKANPTDKETVDLNAGISWTSRNFYVGAAAMHINRPSFYSPQNSVALPGNAATDSIHSKIPLSYNFIAGCNIIAFHPLFEIQPMVLLLTDLTDTRLQTSLRMVYGKKYSAGASWRGKAGYSFFAGTHIRNIEVGYAYDLYSGGSHEVSFSYRFPIDLFRKEPMPYKSIRFL